MYYMLFILCHYGVRFLYSAQSLVDLAFLHLPILFMSPIQLWW